MPTERSYTFEQLEARVKKLEDGILGTMEQPGLKNIVYNTHEMAKNTQTMLGELKDDFMVHASNMEAKINQGKGAWWVVAGLIGFIMFCIGIYFKTH